MISTIHLANPLEWKNSIEEFLRKEIDFQALVEPWNAMEGILWGSFWAVSAWISATSLYELYDSITHLPSDDRFYKIGLAVKTALSNLTSLFGSTAYNLRWAHDVKILSLGQYAPLFKGLSYGASTVVNLIEGGWSIYNLHREKESIESPISSAEKEKHKQRFFLSMMKVIEHTSMVAWAALGITAVATGVAITPFLTFPLLALGSVLAVAAFFYENQIEGKKLPTL